MKYKIGSALVLLSMTGMGQVHVQPAAGVHLQQGAELYIQSDFFAEDDVSGEGTVVMTGDSLQNINTTGFTIPALRISNGKGVQMSGDLSIRNHVNLAEGNIVVNRYLLNLGEDAVLENVNENVIVTNSTGVVRRQVNADLQNYMVPLSNGVVYSPLILSTRGKYANGYVELSSSAGASEHKPANATDHLNRHWKLASRGIDGQVDAYAAVHTGERNLSAYLWQDGKWNPSSGNNGVIRGTIKGGEAELYAMSLNSSSLQPNPTNGSTTLVFTCEEAGTGQLTVVDVRGRVIEARNITSVAGINRYQLHLANVVKGYYEVNLLLNGKKTTLKLIKQ